MKTLVLVCLLACIAGIAPRARAADIDKDGAALVAQFKQAWDRADAAAIAHLFAPDADLIGANGLWMRGQDAILAYYGTAFQQGFRGSKAGGEVHGVRALSPDLVLIDATWSITGSTLPNGQIRPPVAGILAAVARCHAHVCRIEAYRETTGAKKFLE